MLDVSSLFECKSTKFYHFSQISEDELHDWIKKQLLAYIMDDARYDI